MIYKNISATSKVFYGKTFHPDEEHEVSGYINAPGFIRLSKKSKSSVKLDNKIDESKKVDKKSKEPKQEENSNGSNSN